MRRNKLISECTSEEILNIGKKLIDYYLEKTNRTFSFSPQTPYWENEPICRTVPSGLDHVKCKTATVDSIDIALEQ